MIKVGDFLEYRWDKVNRIVVCTEINKAGICVTWTNSRDDHLYNFSTFTKALNQKTAKKIFLLKGGNLDDIPRE